MSFHLNFLIALAWLSTLAPCKMIHWDKTVNLLLSAINNGMIWPISIEQFYPISQQEKPLFYRITKTARDMFPFNMKSFKSGLVPRPAINENLGCVLTFFQNVFQKAVRFKRRTTFCHSHSKNLPSADIDCCPKNIQLAVDLYFCFMNSNDLSIRFSHSKNGINLMIPFPY